MSNFTKKLTFCLAVLVLAALVALHPAGTGGLIEHSVQPAPAALVMVDTTNPVNPHGQYMEI